MSGPVMSPGGLSRRSACIVGLVLEHRGPQTPRVVGGIMALEYIHFLILGTCAYVVLQGGRDFADVIKFRILRWGEHPGLARWA